MFNNLDYNLYIVWTKYQSLKLNPGTLTSGNPRKKRKRYIPPMDHPWRRDNFMKFVKAMEGHEEDRAL